VNADLKAGLHGFIIRDFIIRFSILLDRLADGHARYLEPCSIGLTPPPQAEELRKAKDLNFIYLTKSRNLIPGLLALLQPLAHSRFDNFSRIDKAAAAVAAQVSSCAKKCQTNQKTVEAASSTMTNSHRLSVIDGSSCAPVR
jgi:hypothetical protein